MHVIDVQFIYQSIYLSISLPISQSVNQSINFSIYQSINLSIYLLVNQSPILLPPLLISISTSTSTFTSDRNTVDKIRREYNLSIFFLLSYINLKVEAIMTVIHHTSPFNTTLHKNFFLTLFFYRSYPIYGIDWKVRD